MKMDSKYKLTKDVHTFLLKEFKKGKNDTLIIDNENIRNSLLNNKLIEVNMCEPVLCFKLTEDGTKYCEQQIKIDHNVKMDNFFKWITLFLSVTAIILSPISLLIQYVSYLNDKTETTNEITEISDEIIDIVTTIDIGTE